ncbi:uncharacterized protein [Centruroides vittatus]|uniref:uncharacterized protein n=1 Tax=Centruroides vittatus TaxID=120091 RepID=UPI00351045F6
MESSALEIEITCMGEEKINVAESCIRNVESPVLDSMLEDYRVSGIFPMPYPFRQISQVISFIRGQSLRLESLRNAMDIYGICKRYRIEKLFIECQSFIIYELNLSNVCRIHDFACEQVDRILQYCCWEFFDEKWEEIFLGDDFLQCKRTTIDRLLSRPVYKSLTEVSLFLAIYNWVKVRLHRQAELSGEFPLNDATQKERCRINMEPFIPRIRFLAMSAEELRNVVIPLNCLSEVEEQCIRSGWALFKEENFLNHLCSDRRKRNESNFTEWFVYEKRAPYTPGDSDLISIFSTQIKVMEDCFVKTLKLPLYHSHRGNIPLNIEGYLNFASNLLKSQKEFCKPNGSVDLSFPIFVEKNSSLRLSVLFNVEAVRNLYETPLNIHSATHKFFSRFDPDARTFEESLGLQENQFYNVYFDVVLYF